jgi:NAD+ kinase
MNAIVVTPVCPQGLSYRPIVLSPDSRVEVSVLESSGITSAAVDGQGFFPLRAGDSVRVARHPIAYPLLGWSELDPYRRLRERLGWSGRQSPESSRAGTEPRATDDGERGVL